MYRYSTYVSFICNIFDAFIKCLYVIMTVNFELFFFYTCFFLLSFLPFCCFPNFSAIWSKCVVLIFVRVHMSLIVMKQLRKIVRKRMENGEKKNEREREWELALTILTSVFLLIWNEIDNGHIYGVYFGIYKRFHNKCWLPFLMTMFRVVVVFVVVFFSQFFLVFFRLFICFLTVSTKWVHCACPTSIVGQQFKNIFTKPNCPVCNAFIVENSNVYLCVLNVCVCVWYI